MAVSRNYIAELGTFWRDLRTDKKLGLRQAASIAQKRHLPGFTKGIITNLEKGQKNPSTHTLRAAAVVYERDYQWIVNEVSRLKFGGEPAPEPQRPREADALAAFEALDHDRLQLVDMLPGLPDDAIPVLRSLLALVSRSAPATRIRGPVSGGVVESRPAAADRSATRRRQRH